MGSYREGGELSINGDQGNPVKTKWLPGEQVAKHMPVNCGVSYTHKVREMLCVF